ncbi:putative bifunctional diguanylate cyclase/phosphodiesterase [Umezawaea beigongshangensis]|uniref:putative bifunctional diguanylate cyclase/phosphodiesterase n=1 Tax=Umezawaea beigongshangensis TaxID=2780383 RepID=UPI0018F21002|nr:EAL domain-containing protein [Umezawaea beigongshangensis]
MSNSHPRRDTTPSPGDGARRRAALARKWAYLLSGVVVVPLSTEELDRELTGQLDVLCESLHGEQLDARRCERVGERLVALGNVGEAGLRCTGTVLGRGLLALPEFQPVERFAERIVLGLGALACGFVTANQNAVLDQQESLQQSLLKAVRDARWRLGESEARFDEVITSSTSGVVITDVDGRIVRVNAAIGDMLGRSAEDLTGTPLVDLVHPDLAAVLRDGLRTLLDGTEERIRQSQRLLRDDGDVARVSLTASLLRGADERPGNFVAVVEDGTELVLLQGELNRQALHDVLTGLPNRQFFSTNLESALRRADPAHGVTLFHLDVDAFGVVRNGLGRRAAERLLVHVGNVLRTVVADERAMVARFDGDEFAVLVENSATTPDVATIVAAVNEELAQPFYVDDVGLAPSVSVGVVHRPARDVDPDELLRAADVALRRAKTGRRGQWELFHPDQDAEDRRRHALAAAMPGAWEDGEIDVLYRPVVRLADGATAGVEAVLRWSRPGSDPLPHDRCVELAERTGLILPLGESVLRIAGGQAQWWRARGVDLPLTVGLTAHQATDADLVSRLVRVLRETGLPPDRLMIGMPSEVLPEAEAVDNLAVLADMGISTALDGFGLGPGDLAALERLPVNAVRLARGLVERRVSSEAASVDALLPLVLATGATVVVDGVDTPQRARRWRAAGAHTATGDLFGTALPPGDVLAHAAAHP